MVGYQKALGAMLQKAIRKNHNGLSTGLKKSQICIEYVGSCIIFVWAVSASKLTHYKRECTVNENA